MILCQILQLPQTLGPYTVCLSFHPWVREIQKTLTQQWFQCVFSIRGVNDFYRDFSTKLGQSDAYQAAGQ